jgi:signal transduction histidine kinase
MTSSILPTLRSRLTLLYIASTIGVFLLLSGLFSGLLWVALHNQIDHHIHIVTTQAEEVVNNFDGNQEELLLNNLVQMGGMSVIVVTNDGDVLLEKKSPDITSLNKNEIQQILVESEKIGHHPIHFTIHGQRFGSATVSVNGEPSLLAVGYSTKILKDTFYQMVGIVIGVIIFTLPLLTYLGYRLLKRYLHPLEVIAETAQQITHPKKLSSRVTGLPLTREISTIVTSFNGMLGRLEAIFTSEHEFFSDAAHTLKTPLAVLRAKVEGLNKESDAKKQEMIQVIDTTVDTVQDLLLISRIETGISKSSKKVNVSLVVNELAELARSLVQDRTVRVTDNVQNDVKFNGDERLIKKAFGNIVHNAVQYVGETGEINLLLKTDGLNLIFEVMNSGKGIRSNELDHVFERFYRGSNAQINPKGSGLGLAITKAVVESLLGKIEIKSDNLKTSVRLVIPLQ